jgi:pilus assembly protein CpaB
MLLRIALFAFMAIGLAGFAVVAWISIQPAATSPAGAEPVTAKTKVLVAAHPLRGGSLLKPEDMSVQELANSQVPQGASPDTPQARTQLWGGMVRRSLGPPASRCWRATSCGPAITASSPRCSARTRGR